MSSYFGKLEQVTEDDSYKLNNMIMKEAQRAANPPGYLLFWKKYHNFPCTIDPSYDNQLYIPYCLTMKLLKDKYNHDIENDITRETHNLVLDYTFVSSQVCDLGDGVIVHFMNGMLIDELEPRQDVDYAIKEYHHIFTSYIIYCLPNKRNFAKEFVRSLVSMKVKVCEEIKPEASLQMICKNQYGFYLTPIKIKKPEISDLKLHYGEEFEKIHDVILKGLKQESANGLILLHGLPGSGKTHYIRYLIQEVTEKQLIYVPPDMTSSISSPDFLPFMLQNTNSILIIEDAENIIKSRDSKETTTQAVANLLNLSDGLLGDSLHQPIIATFNCELNSIDAALLRKGRLIAQYEFGKLNIDNAQKLSNQLGFATTITEPMTLADIYGQDK